MPDHTQHGACRSGSATALVLTALRRLAREACAPPSPNGCGVRRSAQPKFARIVDATLPMSPSRSRSSSSATARRRNGLPSKAPGPILTRKLISTAGRHSPPNVPLDQIGERYSVPPRIITAIWGWSRTMDGSAASVPPSCAGDAGLDRGARPSSRRAVQRARDPEPQRYRPARLKGSWAGAMGRAVHAVELPEMRRGLHGDGGGTSGRRRATSSRRSELSERPGLRRARTGVAVRVSPDVAADRPRRRAAQRPAGPRGT